MSPVLTELIKAGALTSLLSIAGILLAPPYQEMNAQRANCAAIVEAESFSLALVANPDRVGPPGADRATNDLVLWKMVDEQVRIINKKAAEMGATHEPPISDGPGVMAVRAFLAFTKEKKGNSPEEKKNFTPDRGESAQEYWNKINAVQAGCKKQYSSLSSLPLNILHIW